ncbi:MAG TPA: ABC transporter permease [Actinomycetota bacterium]|nr:ABC transporter permease [Actinomycetota bacterium]
MSGVEVARTREAPRARPAAEGLGRELRGARVVLQRELIRFSQDRPRILSSLLQPLMFLFILGTGLSSLVRGGGALGGLSLRTFFYPGVLAMSTMFTAVFSAGTLLWDREFGFLREMLVAPVRRSSILVGKALGGAVVATLQGLLVLALAGLVGVPYRPGLFLTLAGELFLLSFSLTSMGLVIAVRLREMQTFFALTQMFLMPMFFLSGALYPLNGLPTWLRVLTRVDPLTYVVDPMRRAVFSALDLPASVREAVAGGVTWGSWRVPTPVELALVAAFGVVFLAVAALRFARTE